MLVINIFLYLCAEGAEQKNINRASFQLVMKLVAFKSGVYHAARKLFGKQADIYIYGVDESLGGEAAEAAFREGVRLHKIFNYYDETSELSLLNKKRSILASDELLLVLKAALKMCNLTNGEYDISLGSSAEKRKLGKEKLADELPAVKCDYKGIKVKGKVVSLENPAIKIDLGSIAKGFIVDKMIGCLKKSGVKSALINARGDIRLFGGAQIIGVQHPRMPGKIIEWLRLKNCAVATSGDYNQYYGSYDTSHILNSKELASVTVVAPGLMTADMLATAAFVCKEKERASLLIKSNAKALTIDKALKKHYYNGMKLLRKTI